MLCFDVYQIGELSDRFKVNSSLFPDSSLGLVKKF